MREPARDRAPPARRRTAKGRRARLPQRTASKRASGKRRVAALLARWLTAPGNFEASAAKRSIWSRANASSASSAVARWLMRPATRPTGISASSSGLMPHLPIPVSTLTWTGTALGKVGRRHGHLQAGGPGDLDLPRREGPRARGSSARRRPRGARCLPATVATQSAVAPPSRAARAQSSAPWP